MEGNSHMADLQEKQVIDLLILSVSGKDCALPLARVQEVVPMASLLKPPTMPSVLEGFLNLAGTMHPVIRLDRVLALPLFATNLYTPILILKNAGRPAAFLAEAASRVVSLPTSELHPIAKGESWKDCVLAEFSWNGKSIALLDADRLLGLEGEVARREFAALSGERGA